MSIAKIKSNHSARATMHYVVGKPGARVIGGNTVPWVERDQLSDEQLRQVVAAATRELLVSIAQGDRVQRGVGHTSISFPIDEYLDDQQLSDYCEKYLAAMILTAEQPELLKTSNASQFRDAVEAFRDRELPKYSYAIVRHSDEPHPHAHIVYSRINLETERAISNSFERYRSQEILRDLERQYELEVVPNSWEVGRKAQSISQLQTESETGSVSVQQRLQDILEVCGRDSDTVPEFIEKAQAQGVEVRMSFTRTGKSKGISYCLDGVALSGNSLGTHYSFQHADPGLVKHFNLDYDPQRDNAQIHHQCQQKRLTHDEQPQAITRNNLAASPAPPAPLTLEQAHNLTVETWQQLTPRQQITVVEAAKNQQQTEPRVTVQIEQWQGQEAHLQRTLKELRDRCSVEQKTLKDLEERGQRSLVNPFGVGAEHLQDARDQLQLTQRSWNYNKAEYDQVQERKRQRQQQEAAYQKWLNLPDTTGAQHIMNLLQQPQVQADYAVVQRRSARLQEWQQAAKAIGRSPADLEKIRAIRQNYLDGQDVPQNAIQVMQEDVAAHQKRQRQRELEL